MLERGDPRLAELLMASNIENVIAGINFIGSDYPDQEVTASPAALVYARALAQQDIPLSALLRAYRVGHARFLKASIRYATAHTAEPTPMLIELANQTARWIDLVCDQIGLAYEQERERWFSSQSGLRQQWVHQLLDGEPVEIIRAEDALRYRLGGTHVAVLAWPERGVSAGEVVTLFEQAMSLLSTELGAVTRPLMVPTGEREARMWFTVPASAAPDASSMRKALAASGLPVRLAVGDAETGLEGFRRSLIQAERVKAVALAGTHRAAQVILYSEVAPLALMAGDLDEMRRFVVRVLGELANDDDRNQWLRETLREFLAHNRSYAATAETMFLHRNTIQYRVGQALERCGHSLDDPEAMLNVQFALQACHWLAPAVLQDSKHPAKTRSRLSPKESEIAADISDLAEAIEPAPTDLEHSARLGSSPGAMPWPDMK